MEKLSGIYGYKKENVEPPSRTLAIWYGKGCRQVPGREGKYIKIVDTRFFKIAEGRAKLGPLEVLEWME